MWCEALIKRTFIWKKTNNTFLVFFSVWTCKEGFLQSCYSVSGSVVSSPPGWTHLYGFLMWVFFLVCWWCPKEITGWFFSLFVYVSNADTKSNSDWKMEKTLLQNSYNNLTEEKDQFQNSYNDLSKIKDQLESEYNSLSDQSNKLRSSYESLENQRLQLETKYQNLSDQRRQLEITYENLYNETSFNNLVQQIEQLQTRLESMAKAKNDNQWKLEDYYLSSPLNNKNTHFNWEKKQKSIRRNNNGIHMFQLSLNLYHYTKLCAAACKTSVIS